METNGAEAGVLESVAIPKPSRVGETNGEIVFCRFHPGPSRLRSRRSAMPGSFLQACVGVFTMGMCLVIPFLARCQVVNSPPVPEWIQAPGGKASGSAFFRVGVELPTPMLKVIFLGASPGDMEVFVNGRVAGRGSGGGGGVSLDLTSAMEVGKNVIGVRVSDPAGAARLSALVELNADFARQRWVATSARWLARTTLQEGWSKVVTEPDGWEAAITLGRVDASPQDNPFDRRKLIDAYNSWRLALGAGRATDPAGFTLPPGFKADLVRSALPDEDSWVSMAFDSKGRLALAREKRGLVRLTFENHAVSKAEILDLSLLECRGLLYDGTTLYANANNSKALVRLRDDDDDGIFEKTEELLKTEGGVGHGRNHIKRGPDGWLYLAHGNNVKRPPRISANSPLQGFAEDQLIPNPWDPSMFDGDVLAPAGHVLRLNPSDPNDVQLFAGGLRNPMDIAFNADGELFTFDADMEWDVGAPWYMPNRVLHVVPGADFGFRRGTGRFPSHYPDTLPSVIDVGLASPTAVFFGTGTAFPEKYQKALYVCDWAYGRILAVHCTGAGASYRGRAELFLSGRPLNVTDACVGPDGALWLITGGRATQSGLYRVTYASLPPTEPRAPGASNAQAPSEADSGLLNLRRELEAYANTGRPAPVESSFEKVWQCLGHADRWIRFAARVALERVPAASWTPRWLAEQNPRRLLTGALALVRMESREKTVGVLERLARLSWDSLSEEERSDLARVFSVALARGGAPTPGLRAALLAQLEPVYPASAVVLNPELCRMLVYLKSTTVLEKSLPLLAAATRSEDLIGYPLLLRYLKEGWTLESRRVCFEALARAGKMAGAQNYFRTILAVRSEMEKAMPSSDREQLLALMANQQSTPTASGGAVAPEVQEWTMEELRPHLGKVGFGRSIDAGKNALSKAQCTACHRVSSDLSIPFGIQGPDLTHVSARFGRLDLLDHILNPSKVIDEKFRQTVFVLQDGSETAGVVDKEEGGKVFVRTGKLSEQTQSIPLISVRERKLSTVSPMPEGLLNVLTLGEVLDLLTFFEAQVKTPVIP